MINYNKILQLKYIKRPIGQTPPSTSGWDTFKDAVESAGDALSDFAEDAGTVQVGINAIASSVATVASAFTNYAAKATVLENRNNELGKTFSLNIEQSAKFGMRLDELSATIGIGGEAARRYTKNLAGIQNGVLAIDKPLSGFQKKLLQGQKYMVDQLKVTEKAAEGYEYYAATIAESGIEQLAIQNEISKGIEKATGLSGVQRDLTEQIGNMAANLQLQYSRIPGSLELAILKSRALGLSMADLNKTGTQLLNIESSVGDELEYQLLTGRRLLTDDGESLTNAYRMATIQGDANKQAELMNKLIADEGDTLSTNLIARQQAAKMLGIDEAVLARSIQKQKLITELGAEELMSMSGDKLDTAIQQLQEKYKDDPDKKKMVADLMAASDTRTTQERMADTLDQILSKGIFAMAGGIQGDSDASAAAAADLVKTTSDGIQAGFEKVIGKLSDTISTPAVATAVGAVVGFSEMGAQANRIANEFLAMIPFIGRITSIFTKGVEELTSFSGMAKAGGGTFVPRTESSTRTFSGTINQDFLMRSNGTVVPFTSKDDIVGAKEGGPLAQALSNSVSGGGGITDEQINKLSNSIANSIAYAMKGVTITTDSLYQANSVNGDRFA
jgi:hypothetical protein